MDKMREKFNRLSHMVMKEADEKKKEIIAEAQKVHDETISIRELDFLEKAYEKIQKAVREINKETNEEISKALLESKQALFTRREKAISAIFENVKKKLLNFKGSQDYKDIMKDQIKLGLAKVGEGHIQVMADSEDLALFQEISKELGVGYDVTESIEQLFGGFLMINRTREILCDFSYISRLNEERATFLEKYGISID